MYRADPDRGVTDGDGTTPLPHLHHSTLSPLHGFNGELLSLTNIQGSGNINKAKVLQIFLLMSTGYYCSQHHFSNVEQHFMAVKQK